MKHGQRCIRPELSHNSNKFGKKQVHKKERQRDRRIVVQEVEAVPDWWYLEDVHWPY